jgi:hypothetical protein
VNLSAEGSIDWIRWSLGAPETSNANLKAISNYAVIGKAQVSPYADDRRPLTWSNGSSSLTANDDRSGVFISGTGNGFSFHVPANSSVQTLNVHIGGWSSGGTLTAHLSDGSQPDWIVVTPSLDGQYDRNYQISYAAASEGQTLTINWVMSSGIGNVTIAAASLACSGQSGCL